MYVPKSRGGFSQAQWARELLSALRSAGGALEASEEAPPPRPRTEPNRTGPHPDCASLLLPRAWPLLAPAAESGWERGGRGHAAQ